MSSGFREENLDMMNALEKSDIRVIVVRHEQGAAFMADMYGRLTEKQVCVSQRWAPVPRT